jgi:hypothetical protein
VKRFHGKTGAFMGDFVSGLHGIQYMVFGPDGNLYIEEGNRVQRYLGKTGVFLDEFVPTDSSGLSSMAFRPFQR